MYSTTNTAVVRKLRLLALTILTLYINCTIYEEMMILISLYYD